MEPRRTLLAIAAGLLATGAWAFDDHVFVVTRDAGSGSSAVIEPHAPWTATVGVETVGPDAVVRHFFGLHWVVNRSLGTVQVIDPESFDTLRTIDVGAGSAPHDIVVIDRRRAYVSRHDDAGLLVVDPTSGQPVDTIDLGGFADGDGLPEMSRMIRDGTRLFVQLQRLDRRAANAPVPPSMLAVIDVATGALLDVDPAAPGTQAIELTGRMPSYRMQIVESERRLYVSEPAGFWDPTLGGIEAIDLDTLEPLGFVTTEHSLFTLDLSGFALVSPEKGYVVTHTEFVQSSHLTAFERAGGVATAEIYRSFDDHIRDFAFDAATARLFYPDHTPAVRGVHVFDAETDARLTATAIDTGGAPYDLVVARDFTPGEPRDLRARGYDPATGSLSLTYEPGCAAFDHHVVFGPLDQVSTYAYAGQQCSIGGTGVHDGFAPGTGSWFFLVVGDDGASNAGSYGRDSSGAERPARTGGGSACPFVQDLARPCSGA